MNVLQSSISTAVLAIPLMVTFGQGQTAAPKAELPEAVKAAVQERFPGAQIAAFKQEIEDGKTCYEAELTVRVDVLYAADGTILEEEQATTIKSLPPAVTKALATSKYAKATVKSVERVFLSGESSIVYEIVVIQDGRAFELTMDASGASLSDGTAGKDGKEDDDKSEDG